VARSTGKFNEGDLMRRTDFRPKTWFGAVPETTSSITAIVFWKGSLIKSRRRTGA
jgi:hypothetical protein